MNVQNIFRRIKNKKTYKNNIETYRTDETQFNFNHHQQDKQQHNANSIGLLNQLPNTSHNQNYFKLFFSDINNTITSQSSSIIDNLISTGQQSCQKLHQIQDQLNSIEEMKNKFQNKKKIQICESVQKKSVNKSADRHNLKPSQMPNRINEISEFISNPNQNVKDNSNFYSFKNQKHSKDSPQMNYFQQFQNNNYFSQSKTLQLQNLKESLKPKPTKQSSQNLIKCQCEPNLQAFMTDVRQQMTYLSNKITNISQSNEALSKRHNLITDYNQKLIYQIHKINNDRIELCQTQQKWKKSKNELQIMLKNVMQKKGKISTRQVMSVQDCQQYFRKKQLSEVNRNVQQKRISSKAKVQNLLQRLHIRVQKS